MEGTVIPFAGCLTHSTAVVIPAWRPDRLRVNPLQPDIAMQEHAPALNTGYLSPVRESEEVIIQQRDRKHLPVPCSPDIEMKQNSSFNFTTHTPPKDNHLSPLKSGVTFRSTPRRRLLLDTEDIPLTTENIEFSDSMTPQKLKTTSPIKSFPPNKICSPERTLNSEFKEPIDAALKGLSHTQLIHMIKTIKYNHPEIEQEIRNDMPVPDLKPLEERLSYFLSNIFKSLPASGVISNTNQFYAYSRVSTHLPSFKKCVVEQGQVLVESQHWDSVIQYVFLAWNYVKATPVWDNQLHNAQRKECFKELASFCMKAIKKGGMDREMLVDVRDELQGMVADSEEISSCLKYVQGQLLDFLYDDVTLL